MPYIAVAKTRPTRKSLNLISTPSPKAPKRSCLQETVEAFAEASKAQQGPVAALVLLQQQSLLEQQPSAAAPLQQSLVLVLVLVLVQILVLVVVDPNPETLNL